MSTFDADKQARVKKLFDFLEADDAIKRSFPEKIKDDYVLQKARIINLEDKAYVAANYAFANCLCVAGDEGVVFIDTTEKMDVAAQVKKDYFAAIGEDRNKTIRGMVYTHFHADHTFGGRAFYEDFLEGEEAGDEWSGPPLYASEHFWRSQLELDGHIRPMYFLRGARQYGFMLTRAASMINAPTAKWESNMEYGTLMPSHTVKQSEGMKHLFNLGNVNVFGFVSEGETPCTMTVWVPELKLLAIGDNIYAQFPNLVTLRGSHPRDPVKWINSLEKYIELRPKYMVYGHGPTLTTEEACMDVLTHYRDAMKYIHDRTLKHMNGGMPLKEIEDIVRLPKKLASHKFLEEGYGKVNLFVRGVWQHYAGMFNGSVFGIDPITSKERFEQNLIMLADEAESSGMSAELTLILKSAQMLQKANEGVNFKQNAKFSLELSDCVLRHGTDPDAIEVAEEIYMKGLFVLGKANRDNMAWKNYYVSLGLEITSKILPQFDDKMRHHKFQRMPLEFCCSLFCLHLKDDVCSGEEFDEDRKFTCQVHLSDQKLVTFKFHRGILEYKIENYGMKNFEGEVVDVKEFRRALSHCDAGSIEDKTFREMVEMVDFSLSYRRS